VGFTRGGSGRKRRAAQKVILKIKGPSFHPPRKNEGTPSLYRGKKRFFPPRPPRKNVREKILMGGSRTLKHPRKKAL